MEMVRHKRGDVREDGKVFWAYNKSNHNGEYWIDPNKFEEKVTSERGAKASHYISNREAILKRQCAHNAANRDRRRKHEAAYREAHREARNAAQKDRRASDPLFALTKRVRARMRGALRRGSYTKESKTFDIVGCSYEELHAHIEKQFTDGMSWERLPEIHIDHKIPLASAKTEEEIISLCHYSNLQPLWKYDNLRKGCKMPE